MSGGRTRANNGRGGTISRPHANNQRGGTEDLTGEAQTGGTRGAAAFRDAKEDAKARAYRNRLESVAGLIVTALEEGTEEGTGSEAAAQARAVVEGWLRGSRAEAVRPLHWPLEFPEIMGLGGSTGFDAIVGNPPFIGGQKRTGALGKHYREYLVNRLGGGQRGSADLCAYFLLRNRSLASGRRTGKSPCSPHRTCRDPVERDPGDHDAACHDIKKEKTEGNTLPHPSSLPSLTRVTSANWTGFRAG